MFAGVYWVTDARNTNTNTKHSMDVLSTETKVMGKKNKQNTLFSCDFYVKCFYLFYYQKKDARKSLNAGKLSIKKRVLHFALHFFYKFFFF